MTYKREIYEEGKEYSSALSLFVCEEDKNDIVRVCLENNCSVRISKAAEEDDDF